MELRSNTGAITEQERNMDLENDDSDDEIHTDRDDDDCSDELHN